MQARNILVHRPRRWTIGKQHRHLLDQLETFKLEELLITVSDLLALFDYYAGYPWAINRVSSSTMNVLIGRNGGLALPHMTS